MNWLARSALALLAVGALVYLDVVYFKTMREAADGGAVSEAFLRKGTLGSILKEQGLIGITDDSVDYAMKDMCASDDQLRGFDYHDTVRLRFKIHASEPTQVHFKYEVPDADKFRHRRYETMLEILPREYHYGIDIRLEKGKSIKLTATNLSDKSLLLSDIVIDARFGRQQALVVNGEPQEGRFVDAEKLQQAPFDVRFKGVEFSKQNPTVVYELAKGIPDELLSGVFPGKKDQGFCRYTALPVVMGSNEFVDSLVPTVDITVKEDDLKGKDGILENKNGKGREWEVPAKLVVNNGKQTINQSVGLRAHGGTPGRKKDIQSFRVYARGSYGKQEMDPQAIFGSKRAKGIQTLVLKYTYQAYFADKVVEFNPFNHAFALDIANLAGALVPSHGLVDLTINGESKGLHLAMEHLSDRTLRNWLGRDDYLSYTYKSPNTKHEQHIFFHVLAMITTKKDESILDELEKHYDIDNVINSILLTAYIGDDDYCQGTEFVDKLDQPESEWRVTSINWDLDHAFLKNNNGELEIDSERPAFSLLLPAKSLCPRRWAYSGAYTRSPKFRAMVRARLEQLLENELSFDSLNQLLDYYRQVNKHYYGGEHSDAINDLEYYISERPAVLMRRLNELEQRVQTQFGATKN